MTKEFIIKVCPNCGAAIKVIDDCNCKDEGFTCCGKKMVTLKANSVDASLEKHIPNYEIDENGISASVNHVMENDHYIKWICLVTEDSEEFIYLKPNMDAKVLFKGKTKGVLYSYCNKHGLWKNEIK